MTGSLRVRNRTRWLRVECDGDVECGRAGVKRDRTSEVWS